MNTAIAIGQGAGLATACGLMAIIPLAVLALAALAGTPYLDSDVDQIDETAAGIGLAAVGVADAGIEGLLPGEVRIVLRAFAGAAAAYLATQDELPWAGLAAGLLLGGLLAVVAVRVQDNAARAGSPLSTALLSGAAALVAAGLALIPFVGYALVIAAIWLALRMRRREGEKYAGLRVLR